MSEYRIRQVWSRSFRSWLPLRTTNADAGAGFYSPPRRLRAVELVEQTDRALSAGTRQSEQVSSRPAQKPASVRLASRRFELHELRVDGTPLMGKRMGERRVLGWLAAACCGCAVAACLPNRGTPVFIDYSAAEVWSGNGVLTEVSADERMCRVVFRDSNLITRNRWVECIHVHPRKR